MLWKNEILDYGKGTTQIPPDSIVLLKVALKYGDFLSL